MILTEGYSSCANKENGAINSSHPFDGSLKTLCVNSFAVQAPVENITVKTCKQEAIKHKESCSHFPPQQTQATEQLIYIFKK